MAEYTNIYTGGVVIAGDLEIGAMGKAADARLTVKTLTGLEELVAAKKVYDGMIVYCEATKTYHQCSVEWDDSLNITSSSWKQVEYKSLDELKSLIASETTAAMEFKGIIANGTLPTSASQGDLYKLTAALTVAAAKDAEGKGFTAKSGDSIVCDANGKWYYIPSGDDIEDTWRAIKVDGNEVLGGGITTGAVDFVAGDNVTLTPADGTITISAEDTHHVAHMVVGNGSNDTANEAAENGYVHLNLVEDGEVRDSHAIVGAGLVSVESDADGKITITGKDIETSDIVDGAVTTAKIADTNVTTAKIADANVTTAKLANSAVTTAKIADANVTNAKLANDAVTTDKIADDAIVADKIAANAVTTDKIQDANVTAGKLAANSVTTAKIVDANVTTAKIADANVTTAKIADANVTTAKIANKAVTSDKLDDAVVTELNKAHVHSNKAELDLIKSGDVAKWNEHERNVINSIETT